MQGNRDGWRTFSETIFCPDYIPSPLSTGETEVEIEAENAWLAPLFLFFCLLPLRGTTVRKVCRPFLCVPSAVYWDNVNEVVPLYFAIFSPVNTVNATEAPLLKGLLADGQSLLSLSSTYIIFLQEFRVFKSAKMTCLRRLYH